MQISLTPQFKDPLTKANVISDTFIRGAVKTKDESLMLDAAIKCGFYRV